MKTKRIKSWWAKRKYIKYVNSLYPKPAKGKSLDRHGLMLNIIRLEVWRWRFFYWNESDKKYKTRMVDSLRSIR